MEELLSINELNVRVTPIGVFSVIAVECAELTAIKRGMLAVLYH